MSSYITTVSYWPAWRELRWPLLLLLLAALAAYGLRPNLTQGEAPAQLEQSLPTAFGDWRQLPSPYRPVSVLANTAPNIDQPYDQTLLRTYGNSRGQRVMLAVAWGGRQRQEVKIHRPELCYVAQGYQLLRQASQLLPVAGADAPPVLGKRMVVSAQAGGEAVSYWVRIGSIFSEGAVDTRLHILSEGLQGRVVDGVLVRASVPIGQYLDNKADHQLAEQFLAELVAASPKELRLMLLGDEKTLLPQLRAAHPLLQ